MTWRHDGVLRPGTRRVGPRKALQLHRKGGELRVLAGSIWLTRNLAPVDYLVVRGETFRVGAGDRAVIEAAQAGDPTFVHWQPPGEPLHRQIVQAAVWLLAAAQPRSNRVKPSSLQRSLPTPWWTKNSPSGSYLSFTARRRS